MTITCAHCAERRPHEARGLCRLCYEKARLLGMLSAYPKVGRLAKAKPRTDYWREYKQVYRKDKRHGNRTQTPVQARGQARRRPA